MRSSRCFDVVADNLWNSFGELRAFIIQPDAKDDPSCISLNYLNILYPFIDFGPIRFLLFLNLYTVITHNLEERRECHHCRLALAH